MEHQQTLTKPKRKQVKAACVNCRQACRGCDESRPCKRCMKRGIQDTCEDAPRRQRTTTTASKLKSGVAKAFQAVRQLTIAPRPSQSDTASISTSSLPSYTTTPRSSFQTPRSSFQYASSPRSSFQYSSSPADDIRALFAQQCSINDVVGYSPTMTARQLPTLEPPPKTHSPPATSIAHGAVHRTNSDERIIAKFDGGRRSMDISTTPLIVNGPVAPVKGSYYPMMSIDSVHESGVYGAHSGNKRASCTALDSKHQLKRQNVTQDTAFQLPLPMGAISNGFEVMHPSNNSSWMSTVEQNGPPFTPPMLVVGMHAGEDDKSPPLAHQFVRQQQRTLGH